MKRVGWVLAAWLVAWTGRAEAQEDKLTIGLYAPTAPFGGAEERLGFVTKLADHLSPAAKGKKVIGRVFARASDFSAAVKKGEIAFAVVDGPYAAALGLPYARLAAAIKGGSSTVTWEIVAQTGVRDLGDLRGKTIALPTIGAKDNAFLIHALLEGEVEAGFFGKIANAPDPFSAVTAVGVGRADAAFVPSGLKLPDGVKRLASLRSVGWPMFVALPGADDDVSKSFASAITSFRPGIVFDGFGAPAAGDYDDLESSFARSERRGPLAVPPPARLEVKAMLAGRAFEIQESDLGALVAAPAKK